MGSSFKRSKIMKRRTIIIVVAVVTVCCAGFGLSRAYAGHCALCENVTCNDAWGVADACHPIPLGCSEPCGGMCSMYCVDAQTPSLVCHVTRDNTDYCPFNNTIVACGIKHDANCRTYWAGYECGCAYVGESSQTACLVNSCDQ